MRWTSYVQALDGYQGELVAKDVHVQRLLDLRPSESYDFTRVDAVLEVIVQAATTIAQAARSV